MYQKTVLTIYLLISSLLIKAQPDLKCISLQHIVDGPFSYPSFNLKYNYYVAQQRIGNFLQLFRISDDKTFVQLTFDSANHSHAAFSSDGEWIAYTKEIDGKSDIYLLSRLKSSHFNLTNTPNYSEAHPSWALSDSLVLFNTNQYDTLQEISVIWLHDKITRRITSNHDEDTYGSFSPDKRRVVYTKWLNNQKNPEIYILSLDDGRETRITNNEVRDVAPVWLSDSVISDSQSGGIIFHNLHSNLQRRLTTETEFLFVRGVPINNSSLLCERVKEKKNDGLAIVHFIY